MGYDVTNTSSVVELGSPKDLEPGSSLNIIDIPDSIPKVPQLAPQSRYINTRGTITIEAEGGVPPYTYSIDGVHYQSSNVFTNVDKDNVTVYIKDAVGTIITIEGIDSSPIVHYVEGVTSIPIPTSLPADRNVLTEVTLGPAGTPITIPSVLPTDGVVLLETVPIPQVLLSGGVGVSKLGDLTDVDITNRTDGTILSWDASTSTYEHVSPATLTPILTADIPVVLSGGKTFGKYENGDTIPAAGRTIEEVLRDIALEYIYPVFAAFSVSGQATTVEVGTTLSPPKTFTWTITENSGNVNTLDIYDITGASTIANDTPNDGSQSVNITPFTFTSEGQTQQWRGIGTDITPDPDYTFNSSTFTVTARFYRFYGATAVSPTDSVSVRALPSSDFQTGTDVFNLQTGSTLTKFVVVLPPGVTINSVIDLDALSANITSEYVYQGTISVTDGGGAGAPRSYNMYEMNIAIPYSSNHRHQITAG